MRPLPRQLPAARLPGLLLLLSLALLLLARCGVAAAAGADAQLEALIKIWNGFNNSATALPSWDAATSPCDWGASSGVVCDSTGAVTKMCVGRRQGRGEGKRGWAGGGRAGGHVL